jgi:putative hemolysin
MPSDLWKLIIKLIIFTAPLLLMSAFFSSAETAFTSLNFSKIKHLILKGNKKANKVLKLLKNYNSILITILILNTIINIILTIFSTKIFEEIFINDKKLAVIISMIYSTILILFFGEIIPKSIAKVKAEKLSLIYVYLIYPLVIFFKPLSNIFSWSKLKNSEEFFSEKELIELISLIENQGILEKEERHLIEHAINFDEKKVEEIVCLWKNVIFIYDNTPLNDIKKLYIKEGYTRIPVINHLNKKVIGILDSKEILVWLLQNKIPILEKIIYQPLFIDSKSKLNNVLEKMQQKRQHIAIIYQENKDNYIGIVTLEDVIEELVGEIYDENDEIDLIQEIGHSKFEVNGLIKTKVLFEKYLKKISPTKSNINFLNWYKEQFKIKDININQKEEFDNCLFMIKKIENKKVIFEIETT